MGKILIVLATLALFIVQYDVWFIEYSDLASTLFMSFFILLIQIVGSIYVYKGYVGFDKFKSGLSLKRKK